VSFAIDGHDAVFVIGSSGAGKSTLLRCINRLVEPDRGSVRLDGQEITTLAGAALRAARRFQSADVETAFRTLDRVGLAGFENKRADELSGGQRQRVGIARALVQRPRILLVDEPTSSLDPRTSEAVMQLIVELAAEDEIPALVNIHDVPLARAFARRIIGLNAGVIVFDGPITALTTEALERIYGGAVPDSLAGASR
jgi:phosphonate transport system ATP-binding protein